MKSRHIENQAYNPHLKALDNNKPFNHQRYVKNLQRIPESLFE